MNETFRIQIFGQPYVVTVDWNKATDLIQVSLSENRHATVSKDIFEPTFCMLLLLDRDLPNVPTSFAEIQYLVDILDSEPVDRLYKAGLTCLGMWAESHYTAIQEYDRKCLPSETGDV